MAQGVRDRGEAVRAGAAVRFVAFLRWSAELRTRVARLVQSYGWLAAGGMGIVCLLAGLVFTRWFRHGSWWKPRGIGRSTSQQLAVQRMYNRMLQFLHARGLTKTSGMTPHEFADIIAREWAEASQFVIPLTELYCRVRFGQIPLTQDDQARAQALFRNLRAMPTAARVWQLKVRTRHSMARK